MVLPDLTYIELANHFVKLCNISKLSIEVFIRMTIQQHKTGNGPNCLSCMSGTIVVRILFEVRQFEVISDLFQCTLLRRMKIY